MDTLPFKERLLGHLAVYRRDVLGVETPGTFRHRGKDLSVAHILPRDQIWLNIPEGSRSQVRTYVESNGIKLHRYFHHLNSSQAFALSLFVPFFDGPESAARALLRALGQEGGLQEWRAEAVPSKEEGTNLDAWWKSDSGRETFCEVKLTESEFGTAKSDAAHLKKLAGIYRPRLSPFVDRDWLEPERFFAAYQIMRNLWCAAGSDSARAVFLYPREHVALTKALQPVLDALAPALRERVSVVAIEDVLVRLQADSSLPPPLTAYADTLAGKYVPASS